MYPYINIINNFDARNPYVVGYTYLGADRILTNELSIRENKPNGRSIYSRESTKFDKNHEIPQDTLKNGVSYLAKVRVKVGGKWSPWSPEVKFLCLAEPTVTFTSLDEKNYIYNNDVLMTAIYRQAQGEKIKTYQFTLMNENKVPITKYPVRYPNENEPNILKERIGGLVKGKLYYVGCRVITHNGINHLEIKEFVPHYVAPTLEGSVQVKNQEDNGQILIQTFMKQLLGTQTKAYIPNAPNDDPMNYSYLNKEWVIIPPSMPLYFTRIGMAKAGDWVFKVWCKNVVNGTMLDFSKEFGDGIHVKIIKHDDYVIAEKEYRGIKSRVRSNIVKDLKLNPFCLYVRSVEHRIQLDIIPMDSYVINYDVSSNDIPQSIVLKQSSARDIITLSDMTTMEGDSSSLISNKYDKKSAKVIVTETNGRARLAASHNVISILEGVLGDSIWKGKIDIADKVKIAKNLVEDAGITLTARGSSTTDNNINIHLWNGSEWDKVSESSTSILIEHNVRSIDLNKYLDNSGNVTVMIEADHMTSNGLSEVELDYTQIRIKANLKKV